MAFNNTMTDTPEVTDTAVFEEMHKSRLQRIDEEIAEIDRELKSLKRKLIEIIKKMYSNNKHEKEGVEQLAQDAQTAGIPEATNVASDAMKKLNENQEIIERLKRLEEKGELTSQHMGQQVLNMNEKLRQNEAAVRKQIIDLEERLGKGAIVSSHFSSSEGATSAASDLDVEGAETSASKRAALLKSIIAKYKRIFSNFNSRTQEIGYEAIKLALLSLSSAVIQKLDEVESLYLKGNISSGWQGKIVLCKSNCLYLSNIVERVLSLSQKTLADDKVTALSSKIGQTTQVVVTRGLIDISFESDDFLSGFANSMVDALSSAYTTARKGFRHVIRKRLSKKIRDSVDAAKAIILRDRSKGDVTVFNSVVSERGFLSNEQRIVAALQYAGVNISGLLTDGMSGEVGVICDSYSDAFGAKSFEDRSSRISDMFEELWFVFSDLFEHIFPRYMGVTYARERHDALYNEFNNIKYKIIALSKMSPNADIKAAALSEIFSKDSRFFGMLQEFCYVLFLLDWYSKTTMTRRLSQTVEDKDSKNAVDHEELRKKDAAIDAKREEIKTHLRKMYTDRKLEYGEGVIDTFARQILNNEMSYDHVKELLDKSVGNEKRKKEVAAKPAFRYIKEIEEIDAGKLNTLLNLMGDSYDVLVKHDNKIVRHIRGVNLYEAFSVMVNVNYVNSEAIDGVYSQIKRNYQIADKIINETIDSITTFLRRYRHELLSNIAYSVLHHCKRL